MKQKEGIQYIKKIRIIFKDEMGKQITAWPVNWKCGWTAYWWRRHIDMVDEGRSERRDWKCNNSSKRSGIANQISFDKNITKRKREQMKNVNNLMRQ